MGSKKASKGDLLHPEPTLHYATTTIKVDGMTCGACTSSVEAGFKDVDGAGAVTVSLMTNRAVVHHDPNKLSAEQVAEIIEDRGFDAEVVSTDTPKPTLLIPDPDTFEVKEEDAKISETTIAVGGMTCGACTSAVEAGFKDVAGIKSMNVSLMTNRAVVQHEASIISPEAVAEIIEDCGFDAEIKDTKMVSTAGSKSRRKEVAQEDDSQTMTTTVAIEGMTCGACTSSVEGAFKGMDGLIRFNISLLAERAVIIHDPTKLTADKIVETVEDAGFDARVVSSQIDAGQISSSSSFVQLKIFGLMDSHDVTKLEEFLRAKSGVESTIINLATSRATIQYDNSALGLRAIVEAVDEAGYNALLADTDDTNAQLESLAKTKEIQEWRRAFLTSLSFAIPVFFISMILPMFLPSLDFGAWEPIPGLFLRDMICFVLTVPVQFGIGNRFYVTAWKSVKHGSPTMDVLVVLGTSAAFFFSCFAVLIAVFIPPHTPPGTVFDTSTMLITFITLGRWLENRAKGQTSKALSNLMSLAPSMATIYEDPLYAQKLADAWEAPVSPVLEKTPVLDDKSTAAAAIEKVIPTELIEVGDVVILRPGDRIPADGNVIRGESYVDESMVTGEAMPLQKKKGSALMAGTVNGAGKMEFRVTRAGKDTQLSQIVGLVQDAQTSRAPIQRMADLVAGYFVPVIILLGLITFVGWMVLSHILPHPPEIFTRPQSGGKFMVCLKLCISVIVFACPCALGLATPTAVMVGTGTASQQGILVKGGAALETSTRVTHIVFDKTGTLTVGKLNVAIVEAAMQWKFEENRKLWWTLIALAESGSEHPIAKSVLRRAREELSLGLEDALPGQLGDFRNSVGQGISATIDCENQGKQSRYSVLVGNHAFLERKLIKLPADSDETSSEAKTKTGLTMIYIAINNEYAGMLGLSDTVKPTASAAVAALHKMGISTSIVTGDTYNTALNIAKLVGIPATSIRASVSPGQKQDIIAEFQAEGEVVAMVGDGVNDSPALATANVGIGLVSGSDIAVEAADIVIMRSDDLLSIPASLWLCRIIFRRIKMNLLWACGYNVIGLPFAMGIFLPFGYHMPPLLSATAMMFSSISVTLSSLALRWVSRPRWLNVEALELEANKIGVPVRGQRQKLGRFETIQSRILGAFDTTLGKRRQMEGDRGSYVPLRTVEAVV